MHSGTATTTDEIKIKHTLISKSLTAVVPHFNGSGCVNLRSGPGTTYPTALALRNGVVLKTSGSVDAEGRTWYKVAFDEWIRYPDRLGKDFVCCI